MNKDANRPAPEPAWADGAYIVIDNEAQATLPHPTVSFTYDVPHEETPCAYANLKTAVDHLAYVRHEMAGYEDARLYRLVEVHPDDYKEEYEAAVEIILADRAECELYEEN